MVLHWRKKQKTETRKKEGQARGKVGSAQHHSRRLWRTEILSILMLPSWRSALGPAPSGPPTLSQIGSSHKGLGFWERVWVPCQLTVQEVVLGTKQFMVWPKLEGRLYTEIVDGYSQEPKECKSSYWRPQLRPELHPACVLHTPGMFLNCAPQDPECPRGAWEATMGTEPPLGFFHILDPHVKFHPEKKKKWGGMSGDPVAKKNKK